MKTLFIILLLMSAPLLSQNFEDLRWQKRIVLINGKTFDDAEVQRQESILESIKSQWKEYKLIIITQTNEGEKRNSLPVNENGICEEIDRFEVFLIGLDGRVKFESDKVQPAQKFLNLINSMPMRRSQLNHGA